MTYRVALLLLLKKGNKLFEIDIIVIAILSRGYFCVESFGAKARRRRAGPRIDPSHPAKLFLTQERPTGAVRSCGAQGCTVAWSPCPTLPAVQIQMILLFPMVLSILATSIDTVV